MAVLFFCGTLPVAMWAESGNAPTPLLEYLFDETGVSAPSSGQKPDLLWLKDASGQDSDLHTDGAWGVSGKPHDRAFNNSASTGMGSLGVGGVALTKSEVMGDLESFTITGWFNAAKVTPRGGARLVDNSRDARGFALNALGNGTFGLYVNSTEAFAVSVPAYNIANEWIFFAVTYNAAATGAEVIFYKGKFTDMVTKVGGEIPYEKGRVTANPGMFSVGNVNRGTNNRPFDGYLDNIRIYGSSSGAEGALTLEQLEVIRLNDARGNKEK